MSRPCALNRLQRFAARRGQKPSRTDPTWAEFAPRLDVPVFSELRHDAAIGFVAQALGVGSAGTESFEEFALHGCHVSMAAAPRTPQVPCQSP